MISRLSSISKVVLVVFLGSVLLISCKDDVAFAEENRTMLDTMFMNRKIIMEAEIDSLCVARNEAFYQAAVDSIMDIRIAEIKTRLESIKKTSSTR